MRTACENNSVGDLKQRYCSIYISCSIHSLYFKSLHTLNFSTKVDTYTVDLDKAPQERWTEIVSAKKNQVKRSTCTYAQGCMYYMYVLLQV